jgi:phage shock protein PspC (stress-responsive transcriptional regulator)
MATFPTEQPFRLLSRRRRGRWLGGVCVGLGGALRIHPAWIRAAFVLGALLAGAGILVYVAGWLILPDDGEQPGDESSRWLVRAAKACAACLAAGALAAFAAAATLFGFGWIAMGLGAALLVAVLIAWPRMGPAWALLPLAAIALPTAAVAASGIQLVPQAAHVTVAPSALAAGGRATFRAGLGTLLVDLRRTALPASGVLDVRVQGGVRRTIVALPRDRCVHVDLHYDVKPFWAQVASQFAGHGPSSEVVLFGAYLPPRPRTIEDTSRVPGPVLKLDFSSAGGGLYVRDYPASVDPETDPNWPGMLGFPEPRPDVRGLSRKQARFELESWQARHAAEVRSDQLIRSLMGGPCATAGGSG